MSKRIRIERDDDDDDNDESQNKHESKEEKTTTSKTAIIHYYGEAVCTTCKKRAYYGVGLKPFCGVHSQLAKKANTRITLPKNPKAKANQSANLEDHKRSIEEARLKNLGAAKRGTITTYKMKMMKSPPLVPGVLNVFPNCRHQNRKDGWGCASLSPRSLGPFYHGEPGRLPPIVKTVEAFHQARKVFPWSYDAKTDTIHPEFETLQSVMYDDPFPYRHQYDFIVAYPGMCEKRKQRPRQILAPGVTVPKNMTKKSNVPLFSVWRVLAEKNADDRVNDNDHDHDGMKANYTVKRMTYIESRQFYCAAMELLVPVQPDWTKLKALVRDGTNICICGYDAQHIDTTTVEERYLNPAKPFGHEDVLIAMLLSDQSETWPWNVHRTEVINFRTVDSAE